MAETEKGRTAGHEDIRRADRSRLADIRDIRPDLSKPVEERIREYLEQAGDPCMVKCGDYVIKFDYADTEKNVEERMMEYAAKIAEIRFQKSFQGEEQLEIR